MWVVSSNTSKFNVIISILLTCDFRLSDANTMAFKKQRLLIFFSAYMDVICGARVSVCEREREKKKHFT
jgi:hypothetical protein